MKIRRRAAIPAFASKATERKGTPKLARREQLLSTVDRLHGERQWRDSDLGAPGLGVSVRSRGHRSRAHAARNREGWQREERCRRRPASARSEFAEEREEQRLT